MPLSFSIAQVRRRFEPDPEPADDQEAPDDDQGTDLRFDDDPPGTFLCALSINERKREVIYKQRFPGQSGDLGQNPLVRPVCTRHGRVMTITRSIGNLWSPVHERWWRCSELFTSMGFAVQQST